MTSGLEAELRAALAAHAAEIPADAGARLRHLDYQPRSRRVRPPMAVGALAGAAGAAAAVVSVVGLGTGVTSAFAGWTPSPTAASGAQTAGADAACQARLASAAMTISKAELKPALTDLTPVLTDTRGPFTFVIFASGDTSASCISGPSFTSVSASGPGSAAGSVTGSAGSTASAGIRTGSFSVGAGSGPVTVPAGQIELRTLSTTARDGHAYTFAEGRAGAGVTATTLVLADGTHVQASTANGWFAAWWPGAQSATSVEIATPSGTTTQQLDTNGAAGAAAGPGQLRGPAR